jgi:hypothetical protein
MNTILQKRIEEAAKVYSFNIPSKIYQSCKTQEEMKQWKDEIEQAYIEGGKNSLQNQWISVEEALPPIREKDIGNRSWSDWVLVMTHGGSAFIDCYAFHRKEWLNNGNDVTHWAPIPSLEGGDK